MLYKKNNGWKDVSPEKFEEIFAMGEEYKKVLDLGKTEREFVNLSEELAKECGFIDARYKDILLPGDKVYYVNRNKNIALAVIGKEDILHGINYVVSHIDSPRLDLKQNPLYEDTDLALLDTHYYGGIKKYQWVTLPLAIHGVFAKKDGSVLKVVIGEDENEPVVGVSDLLVHLAGTQMGKKLAKGIEVH